jgi:bifunctional DNA-binding transcriptional regulator/antitoxin component of YhaV-PrlF toxin-antitoxin module
MPLTEKVSFKAMLQRGNRVQIPKLLRWRYKLETNQILNVTAQCLNTFRGAESFFARMSKDGRIVIPKLIIALLKDDRPDLQGCLMQVILQPS